MKAIKIMGATLLIAIGGLFGAKLYAENSNGELAGVLDQLNPLVKESTLYVKTKEADSVNGYGIASYTQQAIDETTKKRHITFTADHELKKEAYLKISSKGKHIITYEEVAPSKLPSRVFESLN